MHMTINQIRFGIVTNQEQNLREIDVRKFLHEQFQIYAFDYTI